MFSIINVFFIIFLPFTFYGLKSVSFITFYGLKSVVYPGAIISEITFVNSTLHIKKPLIIIRLI